MGKFLIAISVFAVTGCAAAVPAAESILTAEVAAGKKPKVELVGCLVCFSFRLH